MERSVDSRTRRVLTDRALKAWSYFGQEQIELDSLSRGVTGTTPTVSAVFREA